MVDCKVVDGLCLTHGYSVSYKVICPEYKGSDWKSLFCSTSGCDSFYTKIRDYGYGEYCGSVAMCDKHNL